MKKTDKAAASARSRAKSTRPTRARAAVAPERELARETLQKFRIVFNSVKSHFRDVEARCGINGAQLWAIAAIAASDGLRVTDLARAMSVHQSTASNLLGELEKQGLIRKERGADQRVVRIYLSREGAAVAARAPKPMIGVLPEALERLPKATLESLSENLDLLIETMHLKDRTAAKTPLSDAFERD